MSEDIQNTLALPHIIPANGFSLELLRHSHIDELLRIPRTDRDRLKKYCGWMDAEIEGDLQSHIEKMESADSSEFGIFIFSPRRYCGSIEIHALSRKDHRCELGYWILSEFEGRGFIARAITALEGVLFNFGLNRIEIRCSSLNERSIRVPKRCGYRFDGKLRDYRFEDGRFRDTLIFSKLRGDSA